MNPQGSILIVFLSDFYLMLKVFLDNVLVCIGVLVVADLDVFCLSSVIYYIIFVSVFVSCSS